MSLRFTPRQRDVMLLRCRDGLTHAETAYRLGISAQTVKNHVTTALKVHRPRLMTSAEICWELSREEAANEHR